MTEGAQGLWVPPPSTGRPGGGRLLGLPCPALAAPKPAAPTSIWRDPRRGGPERPGRLRRPWRQRGPPMTVPRFRTRSCWRSWWRSPGVGPGGGGSPMATRRVARPATRPTPKAGGDRQEAAPDLRGLPPHRRYHPVGIAPPPSRWRRASPRKWAAELHHLPCRASPWRRSGGASTLPSGALCPTRDLCFKCHEEEGYPAGKTPHQPADRACAACHVAPPGPASCPSRLGCARSRLRGLP